MADPVSDRAGRAWMRGLTDGPAPPPELSAWADGAAVAWGADAATRSGLAFSLRALAWNDLLVPAGVVSAAPRVPIVTKTLAAEPAAQLATAAPAALADIATAEPAFAPPLPALDHAVASFVPDFTPSAEAVVVALPPPLAEQPQLLVAAPPAPALPAIGIAAATVAEGDPRLSGAAAGFFSTAGSRIVDAAGQPATIAGVNWFGMESDTFAPHGLWLRGYREMMDQMVELGFNTIRLPFSSELLHTTVRPNGIDFGKNPDLIGLDALQVMDRIVGYAGEVGLRIILDHHRNAAGAGTSANGLWFEPGYTEARWIADWQDLAARYAGNPTVIGADLHNEPFAGTWGDGGATDWKAAAERAGNAVLAQNPDWLIFVEGIADYQDTSYWWGGNLAGVRDHPVVLSQPGKLVYSPHDYPYSVFPQAWFEGPDFAAALPARFDMMWGFIQREGIAPVYLGEFGTKLEDARDIAWLQKITAYLGGDYDGDGTRDRPAGEPGPGFSWWSWNANSGDTGGILAEDWHTVLTRKMDYLQPLLPGAQGPELVFTVTLSQPATTPVSVDYRTVEDSAGAADFMAAQGTLVFAPGETRKTVTIAVTPDRMPEGDERLWLRLDHPQGATLANVAASGTIHDDDAPPVLPDWPAARMVDAITGL